MSVEFRDLTEAEKQNRLHELTIPCSGTTELFYKIDAYLYLDPDGVAGPARRRRTLLLMAAITNGLDTSVIRDHLNELKVRIKRYKSYSSRQRVLTGDIKYLEEKIAEEEAEKENAEANREKFLGLVLPRLMRDSAEEELKAADIFYVHFLKNMLICYDYIDVSKMGNPASALTNQLLKKMKISGEELQAAAQANLDAIDLLEGTDFKWKTFTFMGISAGKKYGMTFPGAILLLSKVSLDKLLAVSGENSLLMDYEPASLMLHGMQMRPILTVLALPDRFDENDELVSEGWLEKIRESKKGYPPTETFGRFFYQDGVLRQMA